MGGRGSTVNIHVTLSVSTFEIWLSPNPLWKLIRYIFQIFDTLPNVSVIFIPNINKCYLFFFFFDCFLNYRNKYQAYIKPFNMLYPTKCGGTEFSAEKILRRTKFPAKMYNFGRFIHHNSANKIFWQTIFSLDKIHINWTDEMIREIDFDILDNNLVKIGGS